LCDASALRARKAHESGKGAVFPGNLANGPIKPSVDFVDGSGNKTPDTVRSQIVPFPVLTALATQVFARLRILIDLLLFSVQSRAKIIHYISFIRCTKEEVRHIYCNII
jgi:hypothetical protein